MAPRTHQRSSQLGRTLYFLNPNKGEKLKIATEPEPLDINLQERAIETLIDNSLPAVQVIEELKIEAEQGYMPSFIS